MLVPPLVERVPKRRRFVLAKTPAGPEARAYRASPNHDELRQSILLRLPFAEVDDTYLIKQLEVISDVVNSHILVSCDQVILDLPDVALAIQQVQDYILRLEDMRHRADIFDNPEIGGFGAVGDIVIVVDVHGTSDAPVGHQARKLDRSWPRPGIRFGPGPGFLAVGLSLRRLLEYEVNLLSLLFLCKLTSKHEPGTADLIDEGIDL